MFAIGSYVAVAMVLRTEWAASRICHQGASVLSRLVGEPVVLSRCSFDPWKTRVEVEGLRLGAAGGAFSARRLVVGFSLFSLGRSLGVTHLELDGARLDLDLSGSREGGGSSAFPGGDCLKPLERVPVGLAKIRDARLSAHLPDGSELVVEGVDLDLEREGRLQRMQAQVASGRFSRDGQEPLILDGFSANLALSPAEERLEIASLEAKGVGVSLSVRGVVEKVCAPQLDLDGTLAADLGTLAARLAPTMENVSGSATLGFEVDGPLGNPRAEAILGLASLTLEDMDLGDVSAGLDFSDGKLRLRDLVWPVGEGRATVNGEVELGGTFPVIVDVETERMDFHRMMAKLPVKNTPVLMSIDSVHRLEGHLAGGFSLEGTSHLEMRGFAVRNTPWHAPRGTVVVEVPGLATLDGRVRITADGIHLSQGRAAFGEGTNLDIDARLHFDEEKGLQIHARSPFFRMVDVRSHVATVPIGGEGQIQAWIAGPYADPLIEGDIDLTEVALFSGSLGRLQGRVVSRPGQGTLRFEELRGQVGQTPYGGSVALLIEGETSIEGEISVQRGGRLSDVFAAAKDLAPPFAWLQDHLSGNVQSLVARFRGDLPNIQGEGRLQAGEVRFLDRPFDSLGVEVALPDISSLHFSEVLLGRGEGEARMEGEIRFPPDSTASVDARLDASGLPLRDLLGEFGTWAELEGRVGASASLGGRIDDLEIHGEIHGADLGAKGVPLAATRLSLETQGDRVIVRGPVGGAGNLSAAVRLAEGLPFDAELELDLPSLEEFLPGASPVGGRVAGRAFATGSLSDIAESSGEILLRELVLSIAGYEVESVQASKLTFSGPSFVLHGLELMGENTELSLVGNRSAAGNIDLQAQGKFDARLLGAFLSEVEHPSGLVSIKATMSGTPERPALVGSAEIRKGSLRLRNLPLQLQGVTGNLTFSQNQVVIQQATMTANGGPMTVGGTVSLRNFLPDVLDLVFEGRGMSWRLPAEWPAVVSGRLALTGQWTSRILISGEARVERLRWLKDLDLEKMILDVRKKVQAVTSAEEREWVRFDLDLLGGQDMRVDSNHLRARLQFVGGKLRLVGTNVRPALLGSVEVVDGAAFFRGNEYRVTNGMVDFRHRDRLDPSFDLTAETEVRDYRIAAHAYGRLEDFQVDLRSDPALAQADVLTLLTFGITSRDLDTGGANPLSGASVAAEALLAVSGLDEHVKRWLPRTPLLMDPDLSVTNQFSELTGQMEPMAVFEAKVLTDRLKLSAVAPFATTKGRKAAAELRVSDRLSSQLTWQNEAVGYSSGDLGFDLKLRWEWE